jgi:Family of unknown function (DUF5994)
MMRNPNAIRSPTPAHNPDAPPPLRLQLDPNRPAEPYLDGAFWPRSQVLSTELPALLAALSTDLGQIALVGYHRDAWNAAPGQLEMSGHAVHLEGFVSPDPPTMVVIANSGRRVTLRVVPPETDDATAAQAMAVATHRSVEADTGRRASEADTAEARSLDELATRLARLPANAEPGQAALISRWVAEVADQFTNAPIQAFVPILVEHIVRGRLQDAHADRDARAT